MTLKSPILILTLFSLIVTIVACQNTSDRTEEEQVNEASQLEGRQVTETNANADSQHREVEDLIQVEIPEPGSAISSPQEIRGKARGNWFFEGDFAVYLLDENGEEMAVAIAAADGEWMTTQWVDFTATMEFDLPMDGEGYLVFEKSNPSDNRDLDRELRIPVSF